MELLYPENIQKYKGIITEKKNHYTYKLMIDRFISLKDKIYKPINKYNQYLKIDKKKLDKIKKENAIKYNCFVNDYHIIDDYCYVYLNKNMYTGKRYKILVDIEDIPVLEHFKWLIQKNRVSPIDYVSDEDLLKFKDYLLKINPEYNFETCPKNRFILFQEFKCGVSYLNIFFKNENILDFRTKNLIFSNTFKTNIEDITDNLTDICNNNLENKNIKLKIYIDNKKCFLYNKKKKNRTYWEVRSKFNNKISSRYFDIGEYGNIITKRMARKYMKKLIEEGHDII